MLERLALGGYNPDQLMQVARLQEWCSLDEQWPLPEEKLAVFLEPDNWNLIMEDLDSLPK
jgi:hypothetical protein